ncbi:DNA methyltransferase [Enterococcus faecalis]|uniref:DNA methyltransferase n=1 Tax=Enterococcus faecalis TaxID=1351 RepID=UPI00094EE098|nr:DNA methyltransferase [Enterococcus faecalis]EGO8505204.1 modification methylase [Enterococcus faecalis]EJZ8711758.1 modification methylase [Enterococcus faecalis]EKR9259858.1 modification methylase [Enterococcus faecalis]MDN3160476.1 DNA methyltransferase [Enterococcus faecalis]MDN3179669.1 DNA methyltransferase [Enterococcus faecalis]
MVSITEILKKKSIDYWDFADSKLFGIHKISSYPATMVPDMQKELIKMVTEEDKSVKNILDPFHGSGVTLVEGTSLGLDPIGFDINPLANLMTLVKLQGVNKKIVESSNRRIIRDILEDDINFVVHDFYNIEKWFRTDIIMSLSKIKHIIQQEKYKYIRQYYWVCLINVIKKYSNTRSSTFKLHIKKEEDIKQLKNDVFKDFFQNISTSYRYLPDYSKYKKIRLSVGDTRELLSKTEQNSIDLICTSPPYGDNGTTVTYGQYSMLPLYWIDKKDLTKFDDSLLENYSSIDSASLGGTKSIPSKIHYTSDRLINYLDSISLSKHRKVINFVNDYLDAFDKMYNVLKPGKFMIVTLGNRRVDNEILPLTEITKDFLLEKGFSIEAELSRNIPVKRMPRKVSRVNNESVNSMNTEYVLILRKGVR